MSKEAGLVTNARVNEPLIIRINKELEDQGSQGDEGGADDGDAVVDVVPGDFSCEVLDLPEPHENIKAETRQPEEDWYHWKLEQETKNDAAAGVDQDATERGDDNDNDVG